MGNIKKILNISYFHDWYVAKVMQMYISYLENRIYQSYKI